LLELIAGNIGTSIEAARYRQRLQEVLAETQQLNEELQVQQEELKTANEELEEQSRILKESQAHLETQQAELEQTNEQLAEQADPGRAARRHGPKNTELNQAQRTRRARRRAAAFEQVQVRIPRQHVPRTAHAAEQFVDPGQAAGGKPQENLSAEQVKFAESIYSAGNDLLNLINDILDISKVEAGKLEMRPENTSVRAWWMACAGCSSRWRRQAGLPGQVQDSAPP
jgi:signal transduction histidine kinase